MGWFRENHDRLARRRERIRILARILAMKERDVLYMMLHAKENGDAIR